MQVFEFITRTAKRRIQRQRAAWEGRSTRYPLVLEIRYTTTGLFVLQGAGTGRTIDMSSSGLRFAAHEPLPTGQAIEMLVEWPVMLEGDIRLHLALSGVVVRTHGTEVAVRIHHYDFRTRGPGVAVS